MSARIPAVACGLVLLGSATTSAQWVCDTAESTVEIAVVVEDDYAMAHRRSGGEFVEDWSKGQQAGAVVAGVADRLRASGRLGRAGVVSIPFQRAWTWDETDEVIRRGRAGYGRADYVEPLALATYASVYDAADQLARSDSGHDPLLLVLVHTGRYLDNATLELASDRVLESGARAFFYFVGTAANLSDTPLHDATAYSELQALATASGGTFGWISSQQAATQAVDRVTESICPNYRPRADIRVDPSPLVLGENGFRVAFHPLATDDREDGTNLLYTWLLRRAGHPDFETYSQERTPPPYRFSTQDVGQWSVMLSVTDSARAHAQAVVRFDVVGTPPEFALNAPSPVPVGERLIVETTAVDDRDNEAGGGLTFLWELTGAPAGSRYTPGDVWDEARFEWRTDATDVTVASTGDPLDPPRPAYEWTATVTDDEGETSGPHVVTVDVANAIPEPLVDGPDAVGVDETLELVAAETEDPDGGPVEVEWFLVQAPDSAAAVGFRAGETRTGSQFSLEGSRENAGAWLVRLRVTDDEGETVELDHDFQVLVPPVAAEIPSPDPIGSLTGTLSLTATGSIDPDSPCPGPDYCHTNVEGDVVGVTPGLVDYRWRLIDVPPELSGEYPLGGVAEVLGVPDGNTELEVPASELRPGEWVFQVEVEDGEGDTDATTVQVEIYDEDSTPVAVVAPPRRVQIRTGDPLRVPITFDGLASFDPDDILTGSGDSGITSHDWRIVDGPRCPGRPRTGSGALWPLFAVGETMHESCMGTWTAELTVTDDEGHEGTAKTSIFISSCLEPVCIDNPTSASPAIVRRGHNRLDIHFHVDPVVRAGLGSFGLAELTVFEDRDGSEVSRQTESRLWSRRPDGGLVFDWWVPNDRPGTFSFEIALRNDAGELVYTAREERAIVRTGDYLDCAHLWSAGFPLEGVTSFPCQLYYEPGDHPADYRIYFPDPWDEEDRRAPVILRLAAEAVRDTWDRLEPHLGFPPIAIILSNRSAVHPEDLAEAAIGHNTDTEPCPIVLHGGVGRDFLYDESPLRFKQALAHEIIHCVQLFEWGWGDGSRWWFEATARYLSNYVYPAGVATYNNYDTDRPLYDFEEEVYEGYDAAIFFQSLANQSRGELEPIFQILDQLAEPSNATQPGVALASFPNMPTWFHVFARDFLTGRVEHELPGTYWPPRDDLLFAVESFRVGPPGAAPVGGEEVGEVPVEILQDLPPFTINHYFLAFEPGISYQVTAVPSDPGIVYSVTDAQSLEVTVPGPFGNVPAPLSWNELDNPIVTDCDSGIGPQVLVVISNASATPASISLQFREDPTPCFR